MAARRFLESSVDRNFKVLTYLEWVLLALTILAEFTSLGALPGVRFLHRWPLFNLVGVAGFGLLGFFVPRGLTGRWCYLLGQASWILVLSEVGGLRLFSLLYLVVLSRCCGLFEARSRNSIAVGVFGLNSLAQGLRYQDLVEVVRPRMAERLGGMISGSALIFGLVVLFLTWLISSLLLERSGRVALAEAHAQLRDYALRIEDQAMLQERNRIAREIHDAVGHGLTACHLNLMAALRLLDQNPLEAKALLLEAEGLNQAALQDIRQSVATLRSDPLQGRSLLEQLDSLVQTVTKSGRLMIECDYPSPRIVDAIPRSIAVAIYRITQEAFTNISKHAQADRGRLVLRIDRTIELIVEDNGVGFFLEQTSSGFGLQGMQERVAALTGTLTIESSPQNGCRIQVVFPLVIEPNLGELGVNI
jgi:signal transduction histidine kinase